MIVLLLIVLSVSVAYFWLNHNYQYWKKRGVPGPKPKFIVGNVGESFIFRKSIGEIFNDIYRKFQNVPFVGVYRANTPGLLICDPEMIKIITVKEFQCFRDNDVIVKKEVDPLFGRNPFVLKGDEWRDTRALLTPCFTSVKMKSVYPLIEEIAGQLTRFIDSQPEATNGVGLEAKELCTKFTLNNVASCAFGLEGKCFEDPNCEFRTLANDFLTPTSWAIFKVFLLSLIPALEKIVSIRFTTKDVEDRLSNIVSQTMQYRKDNNIIRNDFLNFMSQLKDSPRNIAFSDIDITAHAAGFFGDGYETSSIVMSFVIYALANNPKAQIKLREEIKEQFTANNGNLPYDILQRLIYLDAVINETLRLYPPVNMLSKTCTSSYTYLSKPGDGMEKPTVTIEKGTSVILPILAIQNDPKYYDEPEQFRPERFIGENKEKLTKYTYLPFGEGPRACLGQRFGVMQVKTGIAYIVRDFELSANKKTKTPLKYNPLYFMTSPVGGLWIDFKKI